LKGRIKTPPIPRLLKERIPMFCLYGIVYQLFKMSSLASNRVHESDQYWILPAFRSAWNFMIALLAISSAMNRV
jgi:hypothetical protein